MNHTVLGMTDQYGKMTTGNQREELDLVANAEILVEEEEEEMRRRRMKT